MEPTELTDATALRPGPDAAERLVGSDSDLARRAAAVLDANWMGHATRASARLYPHQWSWDSACIAMGYSGWDQERAQAELRWLFAGQWADGLLPHIRFAQDARYFPGLEFWQTHLSPLAPLEPPTSGIVQPPVHATAVWKVFRRAQDGEDARSFLRELQPKLVAWHEYLYRERTRGDDGLVEVWHPWESGMDNSPLWDAALARISPSPESIPSYQRVDVEFVDATQRPTDEHYDRYAYLVKLYRDRGYDAERIREECPFVVRDVLFNSLLVQADRDLAEISRVVGADPEPFEAWADQTAAGLESALWDEDEAIYLDYDIRAETLIPARTGAGFAPLYAGVPSGERVPRLIEGLQRCEVAIEGVGRVVASVPPEDPHFEPALYWRGPVWPMINWVLHQGLLRNGFVDEATEIRAALLELARREGFWEHYDALTGDGGGTEDLSWTAALVLDLLDAEQRGERGSA
jgi:glycogen debranching enzyme